MFQIDMVTVLLASALVSATLAAAFLVLGKGVLRSRALTLWGVAHGFWAIGLLLLLTRGHLPQLASVLTANGCLVLSQGMAWGAARVHGGRPFPWGWVLGVLGGFLAIFTWFTLVEPNIAARIVFVRLLIAAFTLVTIRELWPTAERTFRSGRLLASLSFTPHLSLLLGTAVVGLLNWDPKAAFMGHPVIVGTVIFGVIAHLLWGLGVLVMVFQRMAQERESADSVFKALVEQSLAGIYEIRDGVVTYVNPEMARMFGYRPDEVTGLSTLAVLIAPEDRDRVAAMFDERSKGQLDVARYAFMGIRKTGERFPVEVQGTVIRRDADATVIMGVALDVSDRAAAEQALLEAQASLEDRVAQRTRELEEEALVRAQAEERLKAFAMAIEQSTHMVLFIDARGRVEYANPRFLDMHNLREGRILGRDLVSITPPEHVDTVSEAVRERRPWKGDLKIRRDRRADVWIHATLTPIHDINGEVGRFVVIQTDITDQKSNQAALARARDEAELASRAKSELLANMSHELRTPLNAIIGFSEVMGGEVFGPLGNARYKDYVGDITGSARHLLELINDILDVAAVEAGRLSLIEEEVVLGDLVDSALRLVGDRARQAGLTPRVDLGTETETRLHADPRRVKQILLNLLTNAVKFTPEGGMIAVNAWRENDGCLSLSVTDTGVGMSKEEISIALSRFGQVDGSLSRRQEGAGLGLPLAQDLALLHGAVLNVDSEPGIGTTVTLTLPRERIRDGENATLVPLTHPVTQPKGDMGGEERIWV